MPLLDALRKKDKINATADSECSQPIPEFTFLRTTTNTQEVLIPPSHPSDDVASPPPRERSRTRLSPFKRSPRNPSPQPQAQLAESKASPEEVKKSHRLSSALHLNRSRGASYSSPHVPDDLPNISSQDGSQEADKDEVEARWEKRATLLATGARSRSASASGEPRAGPSSPADGGNRASKQRPVHNRQISDVDGDITIQEAVRLHEAGDLERSTDMFGRLADPTGENNALAQVLYGLALRHGWGTNADPSRALTYLSAAAENAAEIESLALNEGKRKGGAAKGELTLAIYELANSFRHGWGVAKDPIAARQYYANLGDFDAMTEVANCYLEGIGGKKDKWKAAQYLRRAEKEGGRKEVGGSWIWKQKYDEDQNPEQLKLSKAKK